LNVELLNTHNLEPISAAMPFARNCVPGKAHLHLGSLDTIGAIVAAIERCCLEDLSVETSSWQITQEAIEPWDALVMVHRLLPQPAA